MVDTPLELHTGNHIQGATWMHEAKKAKGVSRVRLAVMQWEEKWEAMMSELGKDAKIPDMCRMSALLVISPEDVKEQMMMRLDEIGENYESLTAKVASHTTNKNEQKRGVQKEMYAPMDVDHG